MLSERERQMLHQIESDLSGDRRFAAGLRSGRPKPPREYRRTWTVVLLALALLGVVAVLVTGHWLAAVALVAVAVAGLVRFVTRRLDAP